MSKGIKLIDQYHAFSPLSSGEEKSGKFDMSVSQARSHHTTSLGSNLFLKSTSVALGVSRNRIDNAYLFTDAHMEALRETSGFYKARELHQYFDEMYERFKT